MMYLVVHVHAEWPVCEADVHLESSLRVSSDSVIGTSALLLYRVVDMQSGPSVKQVVHLESTWEAIYMSLERKRNGLIAERKEVTRCVSVWGGRVWVWGGRATRKGAIFLFTTLLKFK